MSGVVCFSRPRVPCVPEFPRPRPRVPRPRVSRLRVSPSRVPRLQVPRPRVPSPSPHVAIQLLVTAVRRGKTNELFSIKNTLSVELRRANSYLSLFFVSLLLANLEGHKCCHECLSKQSLEWWICPKEFVACIQYLNSIPFSKKACESYWNLSFLCYCSPLLKFTE